MGGVFPLIFVSKMASIHLLCLIFQHMQGMSFSRDRVDKFHNIPRPGQSKPGAGDRNRVLLQGKEESFQYGPGFGGPGKGIPPECPPPFAVQTVPFQQPEASQVLQICLHSLRASGRRHPEKTVSSPMAQFPTVYRQLGVVVYNQGIFSFMTLFFLWSELPLPLDPRPPVLRIGPDLLGLNLHTEIHHQPLSADIHCQDMPRFPTPGKGFSYRNFPPWLVAPSMLTAETAAKVHPPLWTLWSFQGFGHTITVFLPERYFPVVKGSL